VKRESPPLDFDLKILLQFFNTPGTEVAPRSDVVGIYLQKFLLIHRISDLFFCTSPLFILLQFNELSEEFVEVIIHKWMILGSDLFPPLFHPSWDGKGEGNPARLEAFLSYRILFCLTIQIFYCGHSIDFSNYLISIVKKNGDE